MPASISKWLSEMFIKDYVNMTCPGQGLPKHASWPFLSRYVLELYISTKLNDKDASFYQSQIRVLNWYGELTLSRKC